MTETAEQLRARAREMKRLAQYADGPAYHREMQAAQALLTRAKELEARQNTESAGHVSLPPNAPGNAGTSTIPGGRPERFEQARKQRNDLRRSANVPDNADTPAIRVRRKKDLARIHLLKKDLQLDDDSYRDLLEKLTGKRSAGKLTGPERNKVLIYMSRHTTRKRYPGRPNNTDSNAQLKKIEALLSEAKRPWEYARAIAERMHGKKRLEFCDSNELSGVIAALIMDAKKHGRRV